MDENKTNTITGDEEISALIKQQQGKVRLGTALIILGFAGFIVAGIVSKIAAVILCVAFFLLGAAVASKAKRAIKQAASSGILKQALEDVFDDVEYDAFSHFPSSVVDSAGFGFNYDEMEGSDYVRGKYKGLNIEMSDINLIDVTVDSDGHDSRTSVFHGMWLICDFGKELTADVRVCERSKLGKALGKGGIKTENEAFNKQFKITSSDEENAFYILTPHMMEYIVEMDEKAKARTYLSFMRGGKLHVALDSGKDAFEVGRGKYDAVQIREQFVSEIRFVTDLIDELRLTESIFKN